MSIVKHSDFLSEAAESFTPKLCACGAIARPNQRNCYRCHALANSIYRARVKHQAEKLQKRMLAVIAAARRLADGLQK